MNNRRTGVQLSQSVRARGGDFRPRFPQPRRSGQATVTEMLHAPGAEIVGYGCSSVGRPGIGTRAFFAALRDAQVAEFGELQRFISKPSKDRYEVDDDDVLRVRIGKYFLVVVLLALMQSAWKQFHGSKLRWNYSKRHIHNRMKGAVLVAWLEESHF